MTNLARRSAALNLLPPPRCCGLKVTHQRLKVHIGLRQSDIFGGCLVPPQSGVGELIARALKASCDTAAAQTVHTGDAWETRGEISGVEFTLRRGEDGLPQSLEIPKALLTAEFREVSPK